MKINNTIPYVIYRSNYTNIYMDEFIEDYNNENFILVCMYSNIELV